LLTCARVRDEGQGIVKSNRREHGCVPGQSSGEQACGVDIGQVVIMGSGQKGLPAGVFGECCHHRAVEWSQIESHEIALSVRVFFSSVDHKMIDPGYVLDDFVSQYVGLETGGPTERAIPRAGKDVDC